MDMPAYTSRPGPTARSRTAVRPEWLIDAWLDLLPQRQADTMREVHCAVLAASTALVPSVKWGNLLYQRDQRMVAQLTPFRAAVHLQLSVPRGPRGLRGRASGADESVLRFRLGQPVPADQVTHQVVGALRSWVR